MRSARTKDLEAHPAESPASAYGTRPEVTNASRPWRIRWLSIVGALVGIAGLVWVLAGLDYTRLRATLTSAEFGFVLLVLLAIVTEQLVRAWKWRQLLAPLRPVATLRLFGAIMAGYLANLLIPFGVSPLVRSWLIARLDGLAMSAVLATVAIDRLIDGIVFACLVTLVVLFAALPDPSGDIRLGLGVSGAGGLVLFILLLLALGYHKRRMAESAGWLLRLVNWLPERIARRVGALLISFADGVVWPVERWRRTGIVVSSVVIKLLAATHFLWAGLAFGVLLRPFDYLFLIAILGFLVILTHFARIPGGFILGAVFALGLLGIGEEQAVAMVMIVVASSLTTTGVIGAFALWRYGVTLADLRAQEALPDDRA